MAGEEETSRLGTKLSVGLILYKQTPKTYNKIDFCQFQSKKHWINIYTWAKEDRKYVIVFFLSICLI
jgi:hypothetical protein